MNIKNILVVHKNEIFEEKNQILKILNDFSVEFAWKNNLKKENFENKQLIISIGGDGTFLSASHFIENQLILGVNSNKERSEGALCTLKMSELSKKIIEIKENKFKIIEYSREKVKILKNNSCTTLELALNETYIGNKNPHHPSNYIIKLNKTEEQQRSSGILITTGTGSTAWYQSMGGLPYKREEKLLKFIVREPYSGNIYKTNIKQGEIHEKEQIEIISLMHHGILAIDSIRTYELGMNDKIEIILGIPLKAIQ